MSSLYGAMAIATGALGAEQGALEATTNNVANVNTPGYPEIKRIFTAGREARKSFASSGPL
jgi:flagellar basal body rod protein FlgG